MEEQVEQLKNALREIMQLIGERDQPLSDEMKVLLARVIEHVANRINQVRQEGQNPPEQEDQTPIQTPGEGVNPGRDSSTINSFGYDESNGELYVKFQGEYPHQNGPVYKYQSVPPEIFELFKRGAVPAKTNGHNAWGSWWKGKSPSLGASMYALIKQGGYGYQRIS